MRFFLVGLSLETVPSPFIPPCFSYRVKRIPFRPAGPKRVFILYEPIGIKSNVRTLDHKPRSISNLGLRPRYEKHLGFMVSLRNYYGLKTPRKVKYGFQKKNLKFCFTEKDLKFFEVSFQVRIQN